MFFPEQIEVYRILEAVFRKRGVHHYLIGANAKDVHLQKAGFRPLRGTMDIDFAVMVPDIGSYNDLFSELIDHGLQPTNESYRLWHEKSNTVIDLLPFGQIEQEYTINFLDRETTLSVIGLKEVGVAIQKMELGESGHFIPVAPIEGIIILKLIAWNERPNRQRDLQDISHFLSLAWDFYEEEAFLHHHDLFDHDDFEMTNAAARIVGRKMGNILIQNKDLGNQIHIILHTAQREKPKPGGLEVGLAQNMKKNLAQIHRILSELLLGIQDSETKSMDGL